MGVSESDQTKARQRLEAAQLGLRQLDATALAGGAAIAAGVVRGALTIVKNDLDGAVSLLSGPGEIARVGCPFCGRMVMPAATLCGFCWRVLRPTTAG